MSGGALSWSRRPASWQVMSKIFSSQALPWSRRAVALKESRDSLKFPGNKNSASRVQRLGLGRATRHTTRGVRGFASAESCRKKR